MKNKKWILLLAILFTFFIGYVHAKTKRIPARIGHSAIYDSANKQMLIFGGDGGGRVLSDLWAYDTEKKTWNEIETDKVPPARANHSAVYDSVNKQMLIFGGDDRLLGALFSDLWAFDIEKKKWEEIKTDETPPARYHHGAIYDSVNKQMLIFGGGGKGGFISGLWAYDVEKKIWKEIEIDETPLDRINHSAIYAPINKQMLVFGGSGRGGNLYDTWAFDTEKKIWKEIDTEERPLARWFHSAVYDSVNRQMLIFGGSREGRVIPGPEGFREEIVLSDLWVFDIEKRTWKEIEIEGEQSVARSIRSAVYDPVNKQILLFGGSGKEGFISDLWAFDIEKKIWEKLKPKYEKSKDNK